MSIDPLSNPLFVMRLEDIYRKHAWLRYEISMPDFINLFPLSYKKGKPVKPEKPTSFALDRDVYLQVLVAFNQSFK